MHLSRHHKAIYFAEHTLRPGDGERWASWNGEIVAIVAYARRAALLRC